MGIYNYMSFAPIILFVYNRPEHTLKTLEALQNNNLAEHSKLFIFCDGPKDNATSSQKQKIAETRAVIRKQKWCKTVTIIESECNKGLAASIIEGVTRIINQYGTAIILEDDIVTGKYFLQFMNDSLQRYENEKSVWHITGWMKPIQTKKINSAFFWPVMDCWGWATWADRWQYFKKDIDFYMRFFSKKLIHKFNANGTEDFFNQILLNYEKKIDTWAIFWYASIFVHNGLCLSPFYSLVKNIGLDNSGVHCGISSANEIVHSLDHRILQFPDCIKTDKKQYKKIRYFYYKNNNPSLWYMTRHYLRIILKKILPSCLVIKLKRLKKKTGAVHENSST